VVVVVAVVAGEACRALGPPCVLQRRRRLLGVRVEQVVSVAQRAAKGLFRQGMRARERQTEKERERLRHVEVSLANPIGTREESETPFHLVDLCVGPRVAWMPVRRKPNRRRDRPRLHLHHLGSATGTARASQSNGWRGVDIGGHRLSDRGKMATFIAAELSHAQTHNTANSFFRIAG